MPRKKLDETLHGLLIMKLQCILDNETNIVKALPKMAKKATDKDLKEAFNHHLAETKEQIKRLEKAFSLLAMKPKKTKVEAIRGLISDADWVMKNVHDTAALDANLIAAAQYVEHYEMAGYGTASEWAKLMGHTEVQDLLEQNLAEEKEADKKLNELATSKINERANTMHAMQPA